MYSSLTSNRELSSIPWKAWEKDGSKIFTKQSLGGTQQRKILVDRNTEFDQGVRPVLRLSEFEYQIVVNEACDGQYLSSG